MVIVCKQLCPSGALDLLYDDEKNILRNQSFHNKSKLVHSFSILRHFEHTDCFYDQYNYLRAYNSIQAKLATLGNLDDAGGGGGGISRSLLYFNVIIFSHLLEWINQTYEKRKRDDYHRW